MAEEAIAKARAIAARLAGAAGGGGTSELGKRKNRWDDELGSGGGSHSGLGLMTKQKVYVPVKQHPETNWIGLLIGPRGKTQKELEQRTGAKIVFRGRGSSKDGLPTGHPDDDEDLHVSVEGPSDSVEKAVLELEDILHNPQRAEQLKQQQLRNLSEINNSGGIYGPGNSGGMTIGTAGETILELPVPNHLVGFIIGRGGENIVKMQAQTGGHVQIAKESEMRPGDTMRMVTLKGSESAVKELKRRIEETVTEKTSGSRSGMGGGSRQSQQPRELDSAFILKVVVPNDKVGLIIGKGGATVKNIQDRTFSQVVIPPAPDEDNPAVRTLSIGAETREAVEACQMEIFLTLQQQQVQQQQQLASIYQPPTNILTMLVPDDKVGVVIGKQGVVIKDLQSRHGVKIQIPAYADIGSNPPVRTVTIAGEPNGQYMAKAEIESILSQSLSGSSSNSYGSSGGGNYYQAQQGYYGQQGQYSSTTPLYGSYASVDPYNQPAAVAQQDSAASTDPTAYYPDFWNYASYYGEEAARAYYTTWAPPVGTLPPSGIVLPVAAQPAAAPADNETTVVVADASSTEQTPEAIAAAWEAYNKQYAEWMQQQMQSAAVAVAVDQYISQPAVEPVIEPTVAAPPPPPDA